MRFAILSLIILVSGFIATAQDSSKHASPEQHVVDALNDLQASIVDLENQRYACLINRKIHSQRPGGMALPREYWIIGNEGPTKRFNARMTRAISESFEEAWYEQVIIGGQTNFRAFWATASKPDHYSKDELNMKVLAFDPLRQTVRSVNAIVESRVRTTKQLKGGFRSLLSPEMTRISLVAKYDDPGNLVAKWHTEKDTAKAVNNSWRPVFEATFDVRVGFRPTEVQFSVENGDKKRVVSRTETQWQQINERWLPIEMTVDEPMRSLHRIDFDWRFGDQLPKTPMIDRSSTDWREPFYNIYDGAWDRRNRDQ